MTKSFGDVRVLEDLTLDLAEGEILALLGLSGSGKTTALRLLAGFESPDLGAIRLAGEDVLHLAPDRRGFGMVFQHYALFPHMTVQENVAFGLESQGWSRSRIAPRIQETLELVDLTQFSQRRVSEISGGQQQRVALARALAPEPRLLLLDEPLSNLDPALRERTRSELREAVRRIGITTVLVTHEQEEAFHVGDRIAVLNAGRLEQVGTAIELYRQPATRFVATFVGRASTLPVVTAEAIPEGGYGRVLCGEGEGVVEPSGAESKPVVLWHGQATEDFEAGAAADLIARPEALHLRLLTAEGGGALAGRVVELRFMGSMTYAVVELDGPHGVSPEGGHRVQVLLDGAEGLAAEEDLVGSRVGVLPRTTAEIGEQLGTAPAVGYNEAPVPRLFPRAAVRRSG